MKRILALAVSLLVIVGLLTACGGEDVKSVVLGDLLSEVNTAYGISNMKVLDKASDMNRYYRIAEEDIKQFAAEMSTDSKTFTEVILVEAVDSAAVSRIVSALNNHLDTQVNTAKSYSKEFLDMIESRTVHSSGNYVYLVISENADAIEKLIADTIK